MLDLENHLKVDGTTSDFSRLKAYLRGNLSGPLNSIAADTSSLEVIVDLPGRQRTLLERKKLTQVLDCLSS